MPPLSSEPPIAYPTSLVVAVGIFHLSAVRLRSWLRDVGEHMVPGATGVLLFDYGQGLCDHSFARDHADGATNSIPHAAANAASHTTANLTCCSVWPS